ncbi:nuclear body protein SP140-like protein isoform X2 [Scleropages formosus]|uniref:nuclear body protein SP140-like protein isoform X2 n=1 Tax=Scleropages formosus TaxID=113540 RepID=UPI0008786BE7|nr:nuclear body protein SP140-like protein isoform X2 [Scleropages formosus]
MWIRWKPAASSFCSGCQAAEPRLLYRVSEHLGRSTRRFSGNSSSASESDTIMDPLDFLTDEQLLQIFHCKKTEMSCIEQPHTFLNQLRDHDLIPEDKYKTVMRSKTKHNREMRMYEMLSWFEIKRPERVNLFWKCVFKDHILQQYHVLRLLRKSLLDGSFSFPEKLPEKETTPEDPEVSSKKVKKAKVEKKKGEKGKEKEAAKKRKQNGESGDEEEQPSCSSQATPTKKRRLSKPTYRPSLTRGEDENFWNWPIYKTQLPVVCGDKTGTLYRDKLAKGEKCILTEQRWLNPNEFEVLGGKKSCKNWKTSIRCRNTTLHTLIQGGHLKCANYKRRRRQSSQSHQGRRLHFPFSQSEGSTSVSDSELEEEEEEGHQQAVQENTGETSDTDARESSGAESHDETDMSVFQGDCLSVTCGSAEGTLYKYRFASGICGKCIRTEDKWLTPEDFTKEDPTLSSPHWMKSIHCHGTPLSFLIKKRILQVHSLLCKSDCCSRQQDRLKEQENDDECFICCKEGDLLCCDHCPRSFHYLCHLPAVDKDILGEKWMCTYCVLKQSQQWRYPSQMTFQAALQSLVSDFILVKPTVHRPSRVAFVQIAFSDER